MRMCLIFVSVPFSVLQRIFPYVHPAIWLDSLLKQNVSHHQITWKWTTIIDKSDRTTDRHTWFFVRFGFWLVDFFGILNPFQSIGTSLIMSTTSLIWKIQYVITYSLKLFYLHTKIQSTYLVYNFFFTLRVFLPDNGNVLYFILILYIILLDEVWTS